ncbi:hypothetical protein ACSLO9_34470, partial [Escherichia coli]
TAYQKAYQLGIVYNLGRNEAIVREALLYKQHSLKSLQRASNTLAKCFEVSSKALGMDHAENDEEEI